MKNPVIVFFVYVLFTICYIVFFGTVISKHRLIGDNNIIGWIISFSLLFAIPLAGLIHLTSITLNKKKPSDAKCQPSNIIATSSLIGLAGPLILIVMINTSADGEAAMGYILIPVAYIAFWAFGLLVMLVYKFCKS